MDTNPKEPPVPPSERGYIAGVYNYCDTWCERCRFQRRCRLYRNMTLMELATKAGLDQETTNWLTHEDFEVVVRTPSEQLEFERVIEAANQAVDLEEIDRAAAEAKVRRDRRASHPIAQAAGDYAKLAEGVLAALRPLLDSQADALVLASLDSIDRFAYLISVKTRRAVGALADADEDDGALEGDEFKSSDGNGCAKLVRLLVGESRDAWRLLTQVGSAAADGVPAAMVRRLDELDAAIDAAFPNAMEFVRAGFDE